MIRLSFISAHHTPLVSDAILSLRVLVSEVIPQPQSIPFHRGDIDVFRVEGIPLHTHVRVDSTRNLFVEFVSTWMLNLRLRA